MESSTSEKHFQFFSNSKCEYFPCHSTNDPENFNCLFCYCPLYALGDKCGGNFTYIAGGIKDCSGCFHMRGIVYVDFLQSAAFPYCAAVVI